MKHPQSPADVHIRYSHLIVYCTYFVLETVKTAVTQERYLARIVAGVEPSLTQVICGIPKALQAATAFFHISYHFHS